MNPYRCPIGRPTLTAAGLDMAKKALNEGSLSEGKYVAQLEEAFAKMAGVQHAIVTSSGHTALVLALRAAKNLYKYEAVVTSSLTFISTVTAALQAGLAVECVDVDDDLLIQKKAAEDAMIRWNAGGNPAIYLPVHLFGQEAPKIDSRFSNLTVHDSCEAMGSVDDGRWIGISPIGCFSFYTSHVLGAGEMGMVVTNRDNVAQHIRQLKDQGRAVLRPVRHIEGERLKFEDRYRHDFEGWNFRTSDVHAALILGNLPSLNEKITRRFANFSALHRLLAPMTSESAAPTWTSSPPIRTLIPHPRFSYLAFPIICRDSLVRDDLVTRLEVAGVETRPIMSVMQREVAVQNRIVSRGCENAVQLHSRSFYVSIHDQLSEQDMEYIAETIKRAFV